MPSGSPPPIQAVYNPTPPVKPAVKKSSVGCLSLLVLCLPIASAALALVVR
jgi:hypothetical protein